MWKLHYVMMACDTSKKRNPDGKYFVSFAFRHQDELDLPDSEIRHQIAERRQFDTREEAETACRFVLDNANDAKSCKNYFTGWESD